jgi:hypothetical protein
VTLVTVTQMQAYLGDPTADATLLAALLEGVEARLVADCRRESRPFAEAESGRVERHDGTGTATLWLDYRIEDLTSVLIGYNPADPDETLDVADPNVLLWQAESTRFGARLRRTDGGVFGCLGQPGIVQVTYDTLDDLPADAALAVKDEVARAYAHAGSEGLTAERLGAWSADYGSSVGSAGATSETWAAAVKAHGMVLV